MEMVESLAGAARIAALSGRLDTATGPEVQARLLALLEGGGTLVADLGGVHHISSAGLRVLLRAARQARATGGVLVLAAPQPQVRDVLETTGFDRVLAIHPTLAAALASLG